MIHLQEAEKATVSAMQLIAEQQANIPVAEAPGPRKSEVISDVQQDVEMQVDHESSSTNSKRKADDDLESESNKKAKTGALASTIRLT